MVHALLYGLLAEGEVTYFCVWSIYILILYFIPFWNNNIGIVVGDSATVMVLNVQLRSDPGADNVFSDAGLQMLALGNQVGKLYVWDLEVEDPHKAK